MSSPSEYSKSLDFNGEYNAGYNTTEDVMQGAQGWRHRGRRTEPSSTRNATTQGTTTNTTAHSNHRVPTAQCHTNGHGHQHGNASSNNTRHQEATWRHPSRDHHGHNATSSGGGHHNMPDRHANLTATPNRDNGQGGSFAGGDGRMHSSQAASYHPVAAHSTHREQYYAGGGASHDTTEHLVQGGNIHGHRTIPVATHHVTVQAPVYGGAQSSQTGYGANRAVGTMQYTTSGGSASRNVHHQTSSASRRADHAGRRNASSTDNSDPYRR